MRFQIFFLISFIISTAALAQKQSTYTRTINERSSAQVLADNRGGYYTAVHQDEYFSGVFWNVVVYLSYFNSCDEELWTKKLISPFEGSHIREMAYFSESSILISLVESDGPLGLIEVDLDGEVLNTKRLEYNFANCDRFHHNYLITHQNREFFITGYTSCGTIPRTAYFIHVENFGETIKGKTFFHSNHDAHVNFLSDGDILGQVGEYYFKMSDFENVEYIRKLSYMEDEDYFLANQPLIDGGFAYLTVEKNRDQIFIMKIDLNSFEEVWKSPLIEMTLPINTNLGPKQNIIVSTLGMEGPNILVLDFSSGELIDSGSLQSTNTFSYAEVDLINSSDFIYINSTSPSNTSGLTELTIELNPLLGLCKEKNPVELSDNIDELILTSVDTSLFIEDINIRVFNFDEVELSTLDTLFYDLICSDLAEENIQLDTTINCQDTLFLEDFRDRGFDYQWSDGSTESKRNFDQSGVYECMISNCRHLYRLNLNLTVAACQTELYIPNIISRNDNQNNALAIGSNKLFQSFELQVHDRWGNQIFYSEDPSEAWHPNNAVINGVYIYKLKYKYRHQDDIQIQTGTLTLID